jgi:crossover junction endodeoxyribonuclease RuvC
MVILGIDPGTQTTGYGIIRREGRSLVHIDNGVISPKKGLPLAERLAHIFSSLKIIIHEHGPQAAAVEEVFVAENARSALILGHARGVALLALSQAGLAIHEYSTREIKKAVVGYGNAEKNQVAQMVKRLLNLPEVAASDASDALAAAICHANSISSILSTRKVRSSLRVRQ